VTRANHRMNQVLDSNHTSSNANARFQEIDDYLNRLDHQVKSSYYRDTIDSKIAQLEKEMKLEESKSI
jgi:hypothetical protein